MENLSVKEFSEKLASKVAVPGGGGACAAAGALAAALGDMVGEFTVGKKAYESVEAEITELMKKAQELRVEFLSCINEDAAAFDPLIKSYKIPKTDPSRDEVIESCLRNAAAAPLKIFKLCMETIDILSVFAEKGSKNIVSDAATGAAICRGALLGAAVNVKVNTKLMKNREYAEEINGFVDSNLAVYCTRADSIFNSVYDKFKTE